MSASLFPFRKTIFSGFAVDTALAVCEKKWENDAFRKLFFIIIIKRKKWNRVGEFNTRKWPLINCLLAYKQGPITTHEFSAASTFPKRRREKSVIVSQRNMASGPEALWPLNTSHNAEKYSFLMKWSAFWRYSGCQTQNYSIYYHPSPISKLATELFLRYEPKISVAKLWKYLAENSKLSGG